MSLEKIIEEFLLERGALKVGFANLETLAGGPPSVDLSYRLAGARSAVSFALPFNKEFIRAFLAKQERGPHELDNLSTNLKAGEISWELAELLHREGHEAKGCAANLKYRKEMPGWEILLHPDISHRYIAARSGVGSFGWSGNVGIKGVGTAIILCTTLTSADLQPTGPVPDDESFCDKCKLCTTACAGEMMEKDKEIEVTIGGVTFRHSVRKSLLICNFVCGGFTGLHRSGKWSTWSPGRFKIPDHHDQDKLLQEFLRSMSLYAKWPKMPGGYQHPALKGGKTYMTCGNCQIVCCGDKKETAKNVKLLHGSGCVFQRPDGSLYAVPPEEGAIVFEEMSSEYKKLYC